MKSSLRSFLPLSCALLGGALVTFTASAQDWPQWGGNDPGRNMFSPGKGFPSAIQPGKFKPNSEEIDLATTKNVKWIAKLGSQSYGNPVVTKGVVLVGTNNASPRDPRFKDDKSVLYALRESDGSLLWQLTVPKLASGKVNDWEYLGLLSSPCVEGDRVYVVTSRCEVLCLDLHGQANGNQGPFMDEGQYMTGPGKPKVEVLPTDADILWKYDMMDELGVFPHNASNCSVIIDGDSIFVCTSNGQDWTHVNIIKFQLLPLAIPVWELHLDSRSTARISLKCILVLGKLENWRKQRVHRISSHLRLTEPLLRIRDCIFLDALLKCSHVRKKLLASGRLVALAWKLKCQIIAYLAGLVISK
jgi:hypothetical protein